MESDRKPLATQPSSFFAAKAPLPSSSSEEAFFDSATIANLIALWMPSSWVNNVILGLPVLHEVFGATADAYAVNTL